jgi:superfamily I DNA and/or RNA helicase/very-short-patch-repair endonuclease
LQTPPSDDHKIGFSQRLKRFQEKSLKVDSRNPSIFMRRISEKKSFDLVYLETFVDIQEDLLKVIFGQKKSVCVLQTTDSDEYLKQSGKLRKLHRTTNMLYEETGQQTLYVGWPFLEGHLVDGVSYIRAPLILFPAILSLERSKRPAGWYIGLDSERSPILNRALFAYMKRLGHAEVQETLQDEILDILDKIANAPTENDQDLFTKEICNLFESTSFPIIKTTNQDAITLEPLKKEDIEKKEKTRIHLKNHFVIGHFPQGNSAIFSDYGFLIDKALEGEVDQGIIDDLLEMPATENPWTSSNDTEQEIDLDKIPDHEINVVLPSDSSQDAVLVASQNNDCTVVRGPPGTGKSQVIVNLISNALSKQQRVMLICKKRAALDVVYHRLDQVGLGKYTLLVEDPEKDKSAVYKKLKRILEHEYARHPEIYRNNLGYHSYEIDNLIEKQTALVNALSKKHFGGISVHELYVNAKPNYVPRLPIREICSKLTVADLNKLLDTIPNIQNDCIRFDIPEYPLFKRKDLANFTMLEQKKIEENIRDMLEKTKKDQLDFSPVLLQRLEKSLETCKEKQGFLSSFNKEKKEAMAFIEQLLKRKITKSDSLDPLLELTRVGIAMRDSIGSLARILQDDYVKSIQLKDLSEIKQVLSSVLDSVRDIPEIQSYGRKLAELNDVHLNILRTCVADRSVFSEKWESLIRDDVFAYWIDHIERENPILQGNPFENYLIQKQKLRQLISEKRKAVTARLISDIHNKITTIPKYKRNRTDEEIRWSSFTSEVSKQRKLKPLRRLMDEYGDLVFSIAPCWLANPESVSQIFPPQKGMFDLIIYDEASQCSVEDALPSLYRGKRIVIAGDEKQLRPFDLWQIKEDAVDEDDEVTSSESLFVLAKRIYGFSYLNWHYRSKYQDLIDFSNHAFYDGHLQVAPNVIRKPASPPIRWLQCDGVWNNNVNLVEASRVVDEIFEIIKASKDTSNIPSIGVITFNEPQQMAILDEIEKRREDPEIEDLYRLATDAKSSLDDRLVVKNIENVQGDERDIIIFSIGYARDPEGVFRLQFGSLNMEGGENRLNVAVTRARNEIVMVSSIDPADIRPDQKKNSGRQRLRDYLLYAKAISSTDSEGVKRLLVSLNEGFTIDSKDELKIFDSPFEEQVARELEARNYSVHTQVGYSSYKIDIGVIHPDDPTKYILGVECDGATFHSARSTRERDVMRQEFLECRGWNIERIWSRNWWVNRNGEIERIVRKIEELRMAEPTTIKKPV